MNLRDLIVLLLVGGIAGWLAGVISKGSGFGLAGNMVVGIAGAVLGGFCFHLLGIVAYGFLGRLIFAVVGALLFTWLLGLVKR
jgi:uncharacterized membrane protein YeaQ/YmgE (transglycosylase-associated protein family)